MIRAIFLPQFGTAMQQLLADAGDTYGISATIADDGGLRTSVDTTRDLQYKQDDYNAYAAAARAQGITPIAITGPWDNGNSRPIAPFGKSYHNYGAAEDLRITDAGVTSSEAAALAQLGAMAPAYGLRWGGTFTPPKVDARHFELALPLTSVQQAFAAWSGGATADDLAASAGASAATSVFLLAGVSVVGLWLVAIARHALHSRRGS